jgi:hypothetical protein
MKSLLLGIFIVISSQIFAQAPSDSCLVKKDGIYWTQINENTRIYLKFYGKDSVVTSSSNMTTEDAIEYISAEHAHLMLSGKFQNKNCFVTLTAKGEMGKVKMEGIVSGNQLALTVINKTDNTYQDFVFVYIPES